MNMDDVPAEGATDGRSAISPTNEERAALIRQSFRIRRDCFLLEGKSHLSLSLSDFLKVRLTENVVESENASLGIEMVQHILSGNYLAAFRLQRQTAHVTSEEQDDLADIDEMEVETKQQPTKDNLPHPLDLLLTAIYMSDDVLRHTLMSKLALCQIAIPFILPPKLCLPRPDNKWEVVLWASEGISASFKVAGDAEARDVIITEMKCRAAVFFRCGITRLLSKSHCINGILSKESHPYFLSREQVPGKEKVICHGLVDAAWFLPRGESGVEDTYENPWIALNVHGCLQTMERGFHLLKTLSRAQCNLVCVFVGQEVTSEEQLEKLLQDTCEATQNVKHILWICTEETQTKVFADVLRRRGELKKNYSMFSMINSANRSEGEMKRRITTTLKKCFEESSNNFSLKDLAKMCFQNGEMREEWCKLPVVAGVQHANGVLNTMSKNALKLTHFPLQSQMPELIQLEKQSRRRNEHYSDADRVQLQTKKSELLQKRADLLNGKVAITFTIFQDIFLKSTSSSMLSFLTHLNRALNMKNRAHAEAFRQDLKRLEKELTQANEKGDRVKEKTSMEIQRSIDSTRRMLLEQRLSVENFLREANLVADLAPRDETFIRPYLNATVQMLLNGFPIELMDGFACNVPIEWLKCVFTELDSRLGSNCRVCVVSVLGVQSSGKSTMLNTMFGLNFNVSVGRCTRGIYAQLLPLDETLQQRLKCTHLLLLDTEGICSPEMKDTQIQDNELATFVVNLSNITIVNISRENDTKLRDILQIVAVATLRMRRLYLKSGQTYEPCCVLVHQNVDPVDARGKLTEMLTSARESLDEAARVAYDMEGIPQTDGRRTYGRIIQFDVSDPDKYVWYVPALWHGNLPMATINPAYVAMLNELKSGLMDLLETMTNQFLPLQLFPDKLKYVWNGILSEHFVFAFRNTLDILANKFVETHYIDWSRQIRSARAHQENLVENLMNEENADLQNILQRFRGGVSRVFADIIDSDFKAVFEEPTYKTSLESHKTTWESKLAELTGAQIAEGETRIRAQFEARAIIAEFEVKSKEYEQVLQDHVRLVTSSRTAAEELTPDEIQRMFHRLWHGWKSEITRNHNYQPIPTVIISKQFDTFVRQTFDTSSPVHSEYIKLLQGGDAAEVIFRPIQTSKKSKKSALPKKWERLVAHVKEKWPSQQYSDAELAEKLGEYFQRKKTAILEKVKEFEDGERNYSDKMLTELLDIVQAADADFQKAHVPAVVIAKLVHYVSEVAIPILNAIQTRFAKVHDPLEKIEEKRQVYLVMFEGLLSKQRLSKTVAKALTESLSKCILESMNRDAVRLLADYLHGSFKGEFPSSKAELVAHCLYSLGMGMEQNPKTAQVFLFKYIRDPESMLKATLRERMIEIWQQHQDHVNRYFECLMKTPVLSMLEVVDEVTQQSVEKMSLGQWSAKVLRKLKSIEELKAMAGKINMISLLGDDPIVPSDLQNECKSYMGDMKIDFSIAQTHVEKAAERLAETVLESCDAKCPFCTSICELPKKHPGFHSVAQHRPCGLSGWRYRTNGTIFTGICNYLVASNQMFRVKEPNEYYPCKKYRDIHPDWFIPQDVSLTASAYWMWVMAKFQDSIAEQYSETSEIRMDIPASWSQIQWEDAVKCLEEGAKMAGQLDKTTPVNFGRYYHDFI